MRIFVKLSSSLVISYLSTDKWDRKKNIGKFIWRHFS